MTGPFFVEGAEPGDALEVRIERMTANRDRAGPSPPSRANVVDPAAAALLPARERVFWRLDRERGVARLEETPAALARFEVPFAPMLGCFGVAPPLGQAISTATSGPYGGNMDYRRFGPGATVWFPVFAPGALFFLGDGHFAQGDGEIVGTGIETSFEVEFTVRVRKNRAQNWPRGETAEHIFTIGNARPLDQALQHATTEMIAWLGARTTGSIRSRRAMCLANASPTTSPTCSTPPIPSPAGCKKACSPRCVREFARAGAGAGGSAPARHRRRARAPVRRGAHHRRRRRGGGGHDARQCLSLFPSKAALLEEITAAWLRPLEASLREAAEGADPAYDKLERMLLAVHRAYRAKLDADPALFDLLIELAGQGARRRAQAPRPRAIRDAARGRGRRRVGRVRDGRPPPGAGAGVRRQPSVHPSRSRCGSTAKSPAAALAQRFERIVSITLRALRTGRT